MQIIDRKEAVRLGLKTYFTGSACRAGHIAARQTSNKTCIECQRLRKSRWRHENADAVRAAEKAYRIANPEKIKAKEARRVRDKDKVRAAFKRWAEANRDAYKTGQIAWREQNRERARIIKRAYKARRRGAEGSFTANDIEKLFSHQNGWCSYQAYCGNRIDGDRGFHIDHVMPLVRGGSNNIENLQLLCPRCNQQKGGNHPDVFTARIISNPPGMAEVIGHCLAAASLPTIADPVKEDGR